MNLFLFLFLFLLSVDALAVVWRFPGRKYGIYYTQNPIRIQSQTIINQGPAILKVGEILLLDDQQVVKQLKKDRAFKPLLNHEKCFLVSNANKVFLVIEEELKISEIPMLKGGRVYRLQLKNPEDDEIILFEVTNLKTIF